eukprot:9496118-Pyramimonas_sp.AAC.1
MPGYSRDLQVCLAHESLCEEIRETPWLQSRAAETHFPECYYAHPVYKSCMDSSHPPPVALALYTDGVRYTSPLNSNADTTTGFWL